jgi:hypothetical protein
MRGFAVRFALTGKRVPFGGGVLAFAFVAITGVGANSTASSGRASQISLQREQRTLRPASPSFAGSMP